MKNEKWEIPERSLFRQSHLKEALAPYLEITKAVKSGNVVEFQEVVKKFTDAFLSDKTFTLISRYDLFASAKQIASQCH